VVEDLGAAADREMAEDLTDLSPRIQEGRLPHRIPERL
jgi:hypothetical protein